MQLNDCHSTIPARSHSLVSIAENLGVDRAHAQEVVGAVFSFCRARHGTDDLSDHYLAFLTARSVCGSRGEILTMETLDVMEKTESAGINAMLRALAVSNDPASLYEAERRNLVKAVESSLAGCGQVIQVNLNRIAAMPHENLSFLWLSVFKRVAEWIGDWRSGNPDLDTVFMNTATGTGVFGPDQRNLLADAVRAAGDRRNLRFARIIWAG